MKNILNKNSASYFVLFFTCVIFGFILVLYGVNSMLKDKINNSKKQELTQALQQILPCNNFSNKVIGSNNFYYCKNKNTIAIKSYSSGYVDNIEYAFGFNLNNNKLTKIIILNHKETPGLGDKITNKKWLTTLYNKTKDQLWLKKDNGQIDAFTAATITPEKLLNNLQENIKWVEKNNQEIIRIINKKNE